MGNANGAMGHGSSSGHHVWPDATVSRNPLQQTSYQDDSTTSIDTHSRRHAGNKNAVSPTSVRKGKRKSEDKSTRIISPKVPSPPPLSAASPPAHHGDNSRNRRVSVAIESAEDPPHQSPQKLPGFRRTSAAESLGSNNGSTTSHTSSLISKARLTLPEAREVLLDIFLPRQGELECLASGFLTGEQYALMRGFWAPFLGTEMRDRWYLDAVMLSVLGKDRWRSSLQQKEVILSVNPTREQVRQLDAQRQAYHNQLRERLLDLCGSLADRQSHHSKKDNLQSLLDTYHRQRGDEQSAHTGGAPAAAAEGENEGERVLSRATSELASPMHSQELLSLTLMRLRTTVSTSFDCFNLIASRIPTSIVSNLPGSYFLSTAPVVSPSIAYQEQKVGDLDSMSFFLSIESRRRLLHGLSADDAERMVSATLDDLRIAATGPLDSGSGSFLPRAQHLQSVSSEGEGCIATSRQLYAAIRHAGLVMTTACSSMVLTVLFQLAEVMRSRSVFRANRALAAQRGVTLEHLIGRKAATVHTYSGKPTEDLEELKRFAITGEMSLGVLTKLLLERFQKDNRVKMEKIRKRYPNLFMYLEAVAPPAEQADFDVTRLLSGMVLKLMFLTGGGQRSIVADDRRIPAGVHQITDDVAMSAMLEVPILSRICWVACMLGMPIMSKQGQLVQKAQGVPMSFKELDECCAVLRALFQAVGALPCGDACPHAFKEWFLLFPFYAVNAEGKRILTYLYAAQAAAIQRVPLTVQKDMTLLSFAAAFRKATAHNRVDVANYLFEPALRVGYGQQRSTAEGGEEEEEEEKEGSSLRERGLGGSRSFFAAPSTTASDKRQQLKEDSSQLPPSIGNGGASTFLLSASVPAGTAAAAGKVMPASLSTGGNGMTNTMGSLGSSSNNNLGGTATQQQHRPSNSASITPSAGVVVVSQNAATTPTAAANNNNSTTSKRTPSAAVNSFSPGNGDTLSGSTASLSCSSLLDDDREVDVYTCVNPQLQLYMRCSNEATARRHRATELTPSVTTLFLPSTHDLQRRRPDIAPALHNAVPKLMPSEGFLVLRWTSAEPLVTFCTGDIISVMAERVSSTAAAGSANASATGSGAATTSSAAGAAGPGGVSQSPRYFTGATRRMTEGTDMSMPPVVEDAQSTAATPSARRHTVTIAKETGSEPRKGLATFPVFSAYGSSADDGRSASNTSLTSLTYHAPDSTRTYHGVMQELLGVEQKVSRRIGVRWTVLEVFTSTQLTHRTRRLSNASSIAAAANGSGSRGASLSISASAMQDPHRHEVVLYVAAAEMPVSMPLKILTIGHERASMSAFTYVSPDDDAVCWANPRLVESIVHRNNGSNSGSNDGGGGAGGLNPNSGSYTSSFMANLSQSASVAHSTPFLSSTSAGGCVPGATLCSTEEELHSVFFSIGVLLSNAITNGVYCSIPIAPLAFLLMKKALASGDYSFRSFMWLEPVDGNLLSPALVLNAAYEVLTMSEHQYVCFLRARGLADPDSQVFPVVHSLAEEMKEDHAHASASGGSDGDEDERSMESGGRQAPSVSSTVGGNVSVRRGSSRTNPSGNASSNNTSFSAGQYRQLILQHNRRGGTFRRSVAHVGSSAPGTNGVGQHLMMSPGHVSGHDTHKQAVHAKKVEGSAEAAAQTFYATLPSRREYLSLYLVNDLAWGSARRDGMGEKNKELWVSMARGFMTSTVAKSPLMVNCCSRVIREVLCIPRLDS